ncbi:hypothetical protein M0811_11421 [Anaeramoeba ignava]|uniref:Fibronectin type-III domain-containing protein n=1 Tax=Anaeramoeba ignava TaxID=1746090 RepID=A0A9Q0R7D7_ANAIG|nr:hypothetical protein M0811_11421 [Anaeramoeba ignava]
MKKIQNKKLILILQFLLIIFSILNLNEKPIKNVKEWIEKEKINVKNGFSNDRFGSSISIFDNFFVSSSPYASVGSNSSQGKVYVFNFNGTNWNLFQNLTAIDGASNDQFGWEVSIYDNFIIVGSPYASVGSNSSQGKAYVFNFNGTNWNLFQILTASDGASANYFGIGVSILKNYIVVGASTATVGSNPSQGKAYVFNFNGTYWNQSQILVASDGGPYDGFGKSVGIAENFIIVCSPYATIDWRSCQGKAYMFNYDGKYWNQSQILVASDGDAQNNFGNSVSITQNYIVIGAYNAYVGSNNSQGKAYVFNSNGTYWNQLQILIASDGASYDLFGRSVSNSENFIIVGANNAQFGNNSGQGKAYMFNFNGTYWDEHQIVSSSDGDPYDQFGCSCSVWGNSLIVGSLGASVDNNSYQGKAYFFEGPNIPPTTNIENCSSLFSSFGCYWEETIQNFSEIEFEIKYNSVCNVIQSPVLVDNVFYQVFNSSLYPNITGNDDYSIQIKACNISLSSFICSDFSNQTNLKTRIDCVKNFTSQILSTSSIKISWKHPNVPIIDSIPKLNHYLISYQKQNSNQTTNVAISNSSTFYNLNNLERFTNYSISICGCRTEQCNGEDEGQIFSTLILTTFASVLNFSCYVSHTYDISCFWNKPNDPIIPSYYNFTYKAISQKDFAILSVNTTNSSFKAKYSDQEYQIDVSACNSNEECGTIKSFQIKTSKETKKSKTVIIVCSTVIPITVIGLIILSFILLKKNKRKTKEKEKDDEKTILISNKSLIN